MKRCEPMQHPWMSEGGIRPWRSMSVHGALSRLLPGDVSGALFRLRHLETRIVEQQVEGRCRTNAGRNERTNPAFEPMSAAVNY